MTPYPYFPPRPFTTPPNPHIVVAQSLEGSIRGFAYLIRPRSLSRSADAVGVVGAVGYPIYGGVLFLVGTSSLNSEVLGSRRNQMNWTTNLLPLVV